MLHSMGSQRVDVNEKLNNNMPGEWKILFKHVALLSVAVFL